MYRNTHADDATVLFDNLTTWLFRVEVYDGAAVEIFVERVLASDFDPAVKDLIIALTMKASAEELMEEVDD